ncbi:two-component response regulator ORR2-like [Phragmites australis]|uniref:two-component response regulator ORR2-like n=1 Tax=Phragmites australis TaxID=29695 RepID=UPI002D7837C2|nr:two-component response regulator ORR2-like [Phragmites australis]
MGGEAAPAAVRVLVVDDSPVDRKVVELLLRNHKGSEGPFHVTSVDSGKKAMELLGLKGQAKLDSSAADANEFTVDIVLTDYCMPEMTGYDLLKAIKALSSPNPIPVVVMSSENEPQRISRCLTAGAEDFILKPLKSKDAQRLHNCSGAARPKDAADNQCESLSCRRKPHSDQIANKVTPEQRSQLTGLAMVLNASNTELSQYFQFLFKFILLAYAVLCLSELLHRWSNTSFLSLWSA